MAFEPLRTDEKLETPVARKKDMDDLMVAGCSGFVAAALLTYFIAIWPFLVFSEAERWISLAKGAGFGLLPAALLGILAARKFGLPGACGFVGGAMATAIFLYLRLQQAFIAGEADQAPPPDYPRAFLALLPLAWLLIAFAIALAFTPRSELGEVEPADQSPPAS